MLELDQIPGHGELLLSWRKQQEQEAWGLVLVGCEQFQITNWAGLAGNGLGNVLQREKGCLGVACAARELRGIP